VALQQFLAPALAAALVHHGQPAGAEHEGQHALGFAQRSVAQALERQHHDVLRQVGGGVGVAQVAQAVAADARRQQAVELPFRLFARAADGRAGYAPGELRLGVVGGRWGRGVGGLHGAAKDRRHAPSRPAV
jgi:hypothetical protein